MKNKKVWHVLVFPGGTENGLEINKSLRYSKEVKLFSVSNAVKNHAEYMYKNHFVIPNINEIGCLESLNKIIIDNKIDFIFPANSLVIDFLIENREKLATKVIQPDNDIVKIIRSKKKTYELFKNKITVPKVFNSINENSNFPIFIKPDSMYGSQGAQKVNSFEALKNLEFDLSTYVISEYLPGEEFSVECFSTKEDGVKYTIARSRERVRMGTSMHSEMASIDIQEAVKLIAKIIFDVLDIDGLWFFQVKYNTRNELTLLEIESRVAGTMAFSRTLGVNLPLANLYMADKQKIEINSQKYSLIIDRSLANRYKTNIEYDTVYIDLDDTIIIKDKINTDIIKFLFQCINKNKKIILISKSIEEDKLAYLKRYKLSNLFDEIIWLNENDSKADFITYRNSIFIDDSFSQRMEVENKCNIFTFEPNMIEVLIDDRVE